jgi:hypothetical protein
MKSADFLKASQATDHVLDGQLGEIQQETGRKINDIIGMWNLIPLCGR